LLNGDACMRPAGLVLVEKPGGSIGLIGLGFNQRAPEVQGGFPTWLPTSLRDLAQPAFDHLGLVRMGHGSHVTEEPLQILPVGQAVHNIAGRAPVDRAQDHSLAGVPMGNPIAWTTVEFPGLGACRYRISQAGVHLVWRFSVGIKKDSDSLKRIAIVRAVLEGKAVQFRGKRSWKPALRAFDGGDLDLAALDREEELSCFARRTRR